MNEILGILIPMLMSGADLMDIVRALSGAGSGAAGMDGLQEMMQTQLMNARSIMPLLQNQKTINGAADSLIDRLGINPFSAFGQGLSALVGSAYHLAPDTMGAVLGVPNGGQFFSTLANGASGISRAAGFGTTDIFNPYSVLSAHVRTMQMARTAYDLGVRPDGGYDISYGHGLNMGEMGKVTQRLLTSEIPYREYASDARTGEIDFSRETGNLLNPSIAAEADKFRENLKKLGAKFNEAVSLLSKVTGSVDEALAVMDRLGDGNFLGGTAEQASSVANRARRMATTLRVASAVAGISPQEMYGNLTSLQQGMAAGIGLNPAIANASGFGNFLTEMAYTGTAAYAGWAAMNPDASPQQRQQALLGANGRALAYARSNGATLGAVVAANAELFTQEELDQFKQSYREGRPGDLYGLIRSRIGSSMMDRYMTDPAMRLVAIRRANERNPELFNDINQAGKEGNLAQAESVGAQRILGDTLYDMESTVEGLTGEKGFGKMLDDAAVEALKDRAVEQGIPEEVAAKMNLRDLRALLNSRPNADKTEIQRTENNARISAARSRIDKLTMTDDDRAAAKERLREKISNSTFWDADRRAKLLSDLDSADTEEKFLDVYRDYEAKGSGAGFEEFTNLRKDVFGGKMTQTDAAREKNRLDNLDWSQKNAFTSDERMTALKNRIKQANLANIGALKRQIASAGVGKLSDNAAISKFTQEAQRLDAQGVIRLGEDDKGLSKTFGAAARDVVSQVFGGRLGDLEEDALTSFNAEFAEQMESARKKGDSIPFAFRKAVDWAKKERADVLGAKGIEALDGFAQQAEDPASNLSQKKLSQEAYLSAAASNIERNTAYGRGVSDLRKRVASGDFGRQSDQEAVASFAKEMRDLENEGKVSLGGDDANLTQTMDAAKRDVVYRIFEKKFNFLKGDALREFTADFVQQMKGDTFEQQFAAASKWAVEKRVEALGGATGEDKKALDELNEPNSDLRTDLNQQTVLSAATGHIERATASGVNDAMKKMAELANGNFGALSEQEAVARYSDYAQKVGAYLGMPQEKLAEMRVTAKTAGSENGAGRKAIQDILKQLQSTGQRFDLDAAMMVTGDANADVTVFAAGEAQKSGLTMEQPKLGEGIEDLLSVTDMKSADSVLNRITNAIRVGGASFQREAVAGTKKDIERLRGMLTSADNGKGISLADIQTAFGTGAGSKEAMERLDSALQSSRDIKYDKALLKTLKDRTVGGESGLSVLYDEGKANEAFGKKGSGGDLAAITKEANRQDSDLYGIMSLLGDFTKNIAPFLADPGSLFKTPVPIKFTGDEALPIYDIGR